MSNGKVAIIDIGSNSVRIVIYERTASGAHRIIETNKVATRLGEYLDKDKRLKQEAVQKLLKAIRYFKSICEHHQVNHIRTVATAALRFAINNKQIIAEIKQKTQLQIELLSGEQEAALGFAGMLQSLTIKNGFLIDIGGGSTEISLFKNRQLLHSVSLPIGCINALQFEQLYLSTEQLHQSSLQKYLTNEIKNNPWIEKYAKFGYRMVGIGGTLRTMATVYQHKSNYVYRNIHNFTMDVTTITHLFDQLCLLAKDQLGRTAGITRDRTDVILPGMAILLCLIPLLNVSQLIICSTGLRDGLYLTMQQKIDYRYSPLEESIDNICTLYSPETISYRNQIKRMATHLLHHLTANAPLRSDAYKLLKTAAPLYKIGIYIDYDFYSEHTFYLLLHAKLYGLTHREQLLTAAIAAYKTKGLARNQLHKYNAILHEGDIDLVQKLGTILKVAAALDRSKQQVIKQIRSEWNEYQYILHVKTTASLDLELQEIKQLGNEFRRVWGIQLVIRVSILHY
ncbi:Ppx/GppA family phosphatase [Paenibacillus yanchengensis]|uniref:Ppx/GppA family phosphatase n=1 Tax=Paenibacillus yanchengensis TaxID=2035833 RepID=A0ABW4YLG6_9BACL